MPNEKNFDLVLLLLRVTFGGLMVINHGWGKLQYLLSGEEIQFPDPLGVGAPASLTLAVFAEFLCAILVMLGLFTRYAVVPLIILLLVAALIHHWPDSFKDKETAILFLVPYICLFLTGAGKYSLDAIWRRV